MPTWNTCFDNVVIGRVDRLWQRSPRFPTSGLAHKAIDTIVGARNDGEALVYAYTFLNHHVGAARSAFGLTQTVVTPSDECVLIDYGCGPATAMMALSEGEFARSGRAPKVHYLGIETPSSPTLIIANELIDCIQQQGLIHSESIWHFGAVGETYPWPPVPPGCPVFFAFCFVLAHPAYDPPPQPAPERTPQRDPIRSVADAVLSCQAFYDRPVHLVYTNAQDHYSRRVGVHSAWTRLLKLLGLTPRIRELRFEYRRFASDRLNGRAGVESWRQASYRHPVGQHQGVSPCDYQIFGVG